MFNLDDKSPTTIVVLAFMVAVSIVATLLISTSHYYDVVDNSQHLTMKDFLLEDRGIVMKITSKNESKAKTVYPYIIVSDRELKRFSEEDGLWVAKGGGLYFLFTFSNPSNKIR